MNKFSLFLNKYASSFIIKNYRKLASKGASSVTGALGHGGVGTYPDRPFLKWRFNFEKDNRDSGWRDNPVTFMEACEKLHAAFSEYAEKSGIANNKISFESIRSKVDDILRFEGDEEGRSNAWINAINNNELFEKEDNEALHYSANEWEIQKGDFNDLEHSHDIIDKEVYKFHQAAIYHRDYTLKNLLPKHGIVAL